MTRTTEGQHSRFSCAGMPVVSFVSSSAPSRGSSGGCPSPAYFCFQQINIALQ